MLEVFKTQFKESIKYGMTYEQFWCDDPQLYYDYQDSYFDSLKEKDILNWQSAFYSRLAIGSLLEKTIKFPDKPLFFAKEKEKQLTMKEKFEIMVAKINANFK